MPAKANAALRFDVYAKICFGSPIYDTLVDGCPFVKDKKERDLKRVLLPLDL
jgi:hypothetical protein